MSESKLISPLLDGFVMGEPVSDHNGIRCCPAMQIDTGRKYIVKIISIPAFQANLDALLLAGAFQNKDAALGYFKELAEEIVEDAVLLQRLSRLEGFISYENWQVVPMDGDRTGYEIYLLGSYRSTLERYFRKEFMTHLRAVNLGLDLCAALGVCRRNGYLYVDLKPDNVVITDEGEYRICDLGFVRLDSVAYASLPDKYRSPYTAPEIKDAYDSLNDTMDTYAVGLILYQAYNNGILPFAGQAPAEPLDPPAYADSEMAGIILKACAPDPKDRWQDPVQMGQALVSYMQRTAVNDVPIAPAPEEPEPEPAEETVADEPSTEQILAEVDMALDAAGVAPEEEPAEEDPAVEIPVAEIPAAEESSEEEPVGEEPVEEEPVEEEPVGEESIEEEPIEEEPVEEESIEEEPVGEETAEEEPVGEESIEEEPVEEEPVEEEPVEEESIEEESIEEEPIEEEPVGEETAEEDTSDDVAAMLAQVDDLIAHKLPDPVVVPEPIDVPIPAPALPEEPEPEEPAPEEDLTAEDPDEQEVSCEEAEDEAAAPVPVRKKRRKGLILIPVLLLLIAALAVGAHFYYTQYYIQTVQDLTLSGFENQLTVTILSDISDELLTVHCSDTYGSTVQAPVENGTAVFTQLRPGTRYRVYVTISGTHKLVGVVEDVYTTPSTTSVTNLSVITGSEDGSVILNFNVQGNDSAEWTVFYQAENEQEKSETFSGHMVPITGLTVGSTYTFRVEPVSELYLVGENTISYTATNIIYAEDLRIESAAGGKLVAVWDVPEGITVESWTVHCYNDADYKATITVTEPMAVFEDLDFSTEYTVEVTAAGMTQSVRTYISPNPITINQVTFNDSNPNKLTVTWDFEGKAPENGWLLLYTVDSDTGALPIKSSTNSVTFNPVVPGSVYKITIQTVEGYTVFNSSCQYQVPAAETFSGYWLKAEYMKFEMCTPPSSGSWTKSDLDKEDYTTTFSVGGSAAFAVTLTEEYDTSPDIIVTLFVIRDAEGNIVLTDNSQSKTWTSMWYKGFGRILVPVLPDTAGEYSMEIYFNGMIVHTQEFSIT